jgi:hypothetical protein
MLGATTIGVSAQAAAAALRATRRWIRRERVIRVVVEVVVEVVVVDIRGLQRLCVLLVVRGSTGSRMGCGRSRGIWETTYTATYSVSARARLLMGWW